MRDVCRSLYFKVDFAGIELSQKALLVVAAPSRMFRGNDESGSKLTFEGHALRSHEKIQYNNKEFGNRRAHSAGTEAQLDRNRYRARTVR